MAWRAALHLIYVHYNYLFNDFCPFFSFYWNINELCPLFPLIYVHHILSMKYTHFLSEVHAHYFHWNIFITVPMKYTFYFFHWNMTIIFLLKVWPLFVLLKYAAVKYMYMPIFFFQWSMPITWSASSAVLPLVLTPWSLAGWRRKPGLPQSRSNGH